MDVDGDMPHDEAVLLLKLCLSLVFLRYQILYGQRS